MKITIEPIDRSKQEEILIRCYEVNDEIVSYINRIKTSENPLIGYKDNNIHRLALQDVYYFEAVDNKVFIYSVKEVYESKQKLYELEEITRNSNFFRCSKSTILNIDKIDMVHPYLGGRFEAVLDNKETIIISRQYVPQLKEKLGLGGQSYEKR